MADVTLAAEVGRTLGSRATRRLRREGKIPGVIYGHGTEPVSVAVPARELRIALNGEAGANQLLSLETGTTTYLALAREMQRHPIAQTVTHVDFQIVRRDEVIAADVPIVLVGEALEVHHGDGLVDQQMFTLAIKARPADIPTSLEVDISELTIGAQLRISDLTMPPGVTTDIDPETAIAIGQPPRVVTLEAEAEEGEEGATPVAAAPGRRRDRRRRLSPARHLPPLRATGHRSRPAGGRAGKSGSEFAGTLHNVGAEAVELVATGAGADLRAEKGVRARVALTSLCSPTVKVALAVPTTYMNESGLAVHGLAKRYGIDDPTSIVVVHDELDLPPGTVRVKAGGGLAGHNGLRSLQAHLHSTDFVRVRIGVGKPPSAARGRGPCAQSPAQGCPHIARVFGRGGGGDGRAHCM